VRRITTTKNETILQREKGYMDKISDQPSSGDIELFD